jgi:hypothetical protein
MSQFLSTGTKLLLRLCQLSYPEPVATGQYDHAKRILGALQAEGPARCVTELLEVWHQGHIITIICNSSTDYKAMVGLYAEGVTLPAQQGYAPAGTHFICWRADFSGCSFLPRRIKHIRSVHTHFWLSPHKQAYWFTVRDALLIGHI